MVYLWLDNYCFIAVILLLVLVRSFGLYFTVLVYIVVLHAFFVFDL